MLFLDVTGQILSTAFHCLYLALIVATILIVIADNRSPVKTMAWILVLFFLPVVGLVLYLLVGRSTRHERFISRSGYTRLVSTPKQMSRSRAVLTAADADDRVRDFFTNVGSALTFGGNSVEVYTDGYGMLSDLIRAISRARHHVHLQFYIFEDDAVGRLLRDVLIDRARQGVKVRLLYDDVGCMCTLPGDYPKILRSYGIQATPFSRLKGAADSEFKDELVPQATPEALAEEDAAAEDFDFDDLELDDDLSLDDDF